MISRKRVNACGDKTDDRCEYTNQKINTYTIMNFTEIMMNIAAKNNTFKAISSHTNS